MLGARPPRSALHADRHVEVSIVLYVDHYLTSGYFRDHFAQCSRRNLDPIFCSAHVSASPVCISLSRFYLYIGSKVTKWSRTKEVPSLEVDGLSGS